MVLTFHDKNDDDDDDEDDDVLLCSPPLRRNRKLCLQRPFTLLNIENYSQNVDCRF